MDCPRQMVFRPEYIESERLKGGSLHQPQRLILSQFREFKDCDFLPSRRAIFQRGGGDIYRRIKVSMEDARPYKVEAAFLGRQRGAL